MGKKGHKDKEKDETPKGSQNQPKNQTSTKPATTSSTPANRVHTDPKVAPQAPTGTVPRQKAGFDTKSNTSTSTSRPANLNTHPLTQKPKTDKDGPFVIPRVEKRIRDPSTSSKGSGGSNDPPPTKKSYAETARSGDRPSTDTTWPEFQIRIYKNLTHHEPITFHDFAEIKDKIITHTSESLMAQPALFAQLQTSGTYYNKVLRCGIINCKNSQALDWFTSAIPTICGNGFRGWTKDEQVTTYVKIFVPQGFEKLTASDYLDVTRLMIEGGDLQDIHWMLVKEYIHHVKQTRIIIASIPNSTLNKIQTQGTETSHGSGVWKIDGFLAPLKLTIANPNDLRSSRPSSVPNKETLETATSPTQTSSPSLTIQNSPQTSPTRSQTPPPINTSPEAPAPLNTLKTPSKDPFLSSTAMSPLRVAMENTHVAAEEIVYTAIGDDMDYSALDSPIESDGDDLGDWTAQN